MEGSFYGRPWAMATWFVFLWLNSKRRLGCIAWRGEFKFRHRRGDLNVVVKVVWIVSWGLVRSVCLEVMTTKNSIYSINGDQIYTIHRLFWLLISTFEKLVIFRNGCAAFRSARFKRGNSTVWSQRRNRSARQTIIVSR